MSYDRSAHLRKPAHVRLYRFEVFHLGREKRLGALDRWLLVVLSMVCDYKTGDYFGTITELAEDSGATRRAVADALDRLHAAEVVQVVSDFGPKRQGHLRVLDLSRVVVDAPQVNRAEQRDTAREPHVQPYRRGNRAHIARKPRANRADTAPNSAVEGSLTSDDANAPGGKGGRGQGNDVSRDDYALALIQKELAGEVIALRERAS